MNLHLKHFSVPNKLVTLLLTSEYKTMSDEDRDQSLRINIDNLTKQEAAKLEQKVMDAKRKIAPDARGTSVMGSSKKLSGSSPKEISG